MDNEKTLDAEPEPAAEAPKPEKNKISFELADFLLSMIKVITTVLLLLTVFFRYATVVGNSMQPSFAPGDRLISSDFFYTPKRGDVVVVYDSESHHRPLIKRVIGLGGDVIDIDASAGVVYRNGKALDESYVYDATYRRGDISYPYTVPKGRIFVMGDNRQGSHDSRFEAVGPIRVSAVIGKVLLRFYPFDRFETYASNE